ncbi:MAG: hypothetical protein ACXWBN_07290 [Acidimicrobiales bacterium]
MKRAVVVLTVLLLFVTACDTKDLVLSPKDGAIVSQDHVTVTGHLPQYAKKGGTLEVNGVPGTIASDGTWSVEISVSTTTYVTPVEAIYTDPDGKQWRQRQSIVHGPKLDEGQASPNGVGMHFTNSGLAGLGPVVKGLAAGAFDIGSLLLAQNPIIDQQDALLTLDITGNAYEAGVGSVDLGVTSTTSGVATHITLKDLYVGVALNIHDGGLINLDCSLELKIPTTTIDATFDLSPSAADPSKVDVNLVGTPAVVTSNVSYEFISGICDGDTFVIGDIVNAVAGPQIQSLIGSGFSTKLGDPDGSGPADSPLADAIETALANISIAGSVGDAVHAHLDAPFTQITEGADAIDFRADADFSSSVGTGPEQCLPPAGAPDLDSTFDVAGAPPNLGPTTPTGQPYGLGLTISASAFNKLLGSMTECGILNQEVTQIPFGSTTLPITAGVLAALAPEFATKLPPSTPLKIRVKPTVSPFITPSAGPNGEPAELELAGLQLEFIENRSGLEITWLTLAVDTPLGFDLAYDPVAGVLAPTITAAPASSVHARVITNQIELVEPHIEALFPSLFPSFVSALGASFAAFPLPGFLGLKLDVAQVARDGNYFVLYANLLPELQTRLENVAVTDLSTADSVVDSVFDVNEWRHRIRPTISPTGISVAYKAMLGADACCTVDDESKSAHAGYRISFDVVPENGDTWHLDVSQLLNGAHTLIDEKVLLEDAGGETRFQTAVVGRVQVGGGAWQNFNVAPSVTSVVHKLYGGEGTTNTPFTGTNHTVLSGTTRQTITVEFGFDLFAKSDSNAFFPAAGGDEVAIRLGANDTIANGFTAGGYPGLGNRSITGDGHFGVIQLTTTR